MSELNRGNIYLSGGMQFAENLGSSWRKEASKKLKEMNYFPIDIAELDLEFIDKFGKMELPNSKENLEFKAFIREHFIDTDLKLIEYNSDALIVYYDESARKGAGTVSEAQFAYNLGIPIFLIAEYQSEEELFKNVSSWLIALSTAHFTNFNDLYKYLNDLPNGILTNTADASLCSLTGKPFTPNQHHLNSDESVMLHKKVSEKFVNRYDFFKQQLNLKY